MPARAGEALIGSARDTADKTVSPLSELIALRVACDGGATRAEIVRDLTPLTQHKLSPAEWRSAVEAGALELIESGRAREHRGRLTATDTGTATVTAFAGPGSSLEAWDFVRDVVLVAKALGLEKEPASRRKALARPEGLRTIILQRTYGLKGKKNIPDAKLRAQLALVALERAFGNHIKAGFSKGAGLPSKAARTLAGQLLKTPRDFPTDAKLIAALAAEAAGAAQPDADALRLALVRGLVSRLVAAGPSAVSAPLKASTPRPAPDAVAASGSVTLAPANDKEPPRRPDLAQFAAAVGQAAAKTAQGWPGNFKAFICHVWDAIRAENAVWGVSEIEFKCMLTEAHKRGAVKLASADLRNKDARHEIERSATPDRNAVWHYVRVEQ